eukprot:gene10388-8330_t
MEDSGEEYEYGSDEDNSGGCNDSASEQDDGSDFGFDDGAEIITAKRVPYVVLPKVELIRRQNDAIKEVTSISGISDEAASRVLRKYKWDVSRVHEEWFSDMNAVQEAVGLAKEDADEPSSSGEDRCMICFDTFTKKAMRAASCGHYFCTTCWQGYLTAAIASGPSSLDLRCPLPDCTACVPVKFVTEVASPADQAKYKEFALRSFVEDNRKISWCVGKGCENAVECRIDRAADDPLDVICTCSAAFCFNCKEEAHRPVSCDTVRKWITKNSAESENLNWILANTKPCPKCHRPIEKNQGCMHMTCSQYETAKKKGDLDEEAARYETAKKKGDLDDEAARRDNAKQSLERYMHYFERWDAHHKARDKAIVDAGKVCGATLEKLSETSLTPTSQLKFISDAWNQIIDCRRILSWTYTFGYYPIHHPIHPMLTLLILHNMQIIDCRRILSWTYTFGYYPNHHPIHPMLTLLILHNMQIIDCRRILSWTYTFGFYGFQEEGERKEEAGRQRTFFEFLQGDAERSLERLHESAESDLQKIVDRSPKAPNFQEFRKNLIGLTDVTHGFFDKLVKQLEKGFDDMAKDYAADRMGNLEKRLEKGFDDMVKDYAADRMGNMETLISQMEVDGAGPTQMETLISQMEVDGAGPSGSAPSVELVGDVDMRRAGCGKRARGAGTRAGTSAIDESGVWACDKCTFNNTDLGATECSVCQQPRGPAA